MATRTRDAYTATYLRIIGGVRDTVPLGEFLRNVLSRQPIVGVRAALLMAHVKALVVLRAEAVNGRFCTAS